MTGIASTGQTPQPQKSAHRLLQRQPDGSLKSVLIDDNTGQVVNNPAGYNVTDGFFSDLNSLGLNPTTGASANTGSNMPQQDTAQKIINPQGGNGQDHSTNSDRAGTRAAARDETNNFGYIDKPSAVSYAGMLPGAIGLAGKAVNAGINANNLAATNAAREELGLPDTTGTAAAKSVLSDNKGQVANIGIGDQNYSVGLSAMSPTGQTNMTPQEARMHALLNNQPITELDAQQAANQQAAFEAANPSANQGIFSGLISSAKNFVNNLFSPSVDTTSFPSAPASNFSNMTNNSGGSSWSDGSDHTAAQGSGSWGSGGFASSNTGSFGSSGSPNGRGPGLSGGGGSLSPGAQGAIDHGDGGLY